MPIAEYYKREIADLNGTGHRQYRYEVRSHGNLDLDALAARVHRHYRMLDKTELAGIASDFIDEMATLLAEGYSVTLGDLGSFSLSIGLKEGRKVEADGTAEEPNARSLCVRGINFKANRRYVADINHRCDLRREGGGMARIHVSPYSRDERIARAVAFIRERGYLRIADYAAITGLSTTTASRELRALDGAASSPLRSDGRGPSKVYRLAESALSHSLSTEKSGDDQK